MFPSVAIGEPQNLFQIDLVLAALEEVVADIDLEIKPSTYFAMVAFLHFCLTKAAC